MKIMTRRGFLFRAGAACAGSLVAGVALADVQGAGAKEEDVSPVEDLMREHGLLRRVLLIYREWIRRLGAFKTGEIDTLAESCRIIRSFVEGYHEKLEEEYLFPRFRKAGKLTDLVDVLEKQHQAGRKLTDAVLGLSSARPLKGRRQARLLARSLRSFIAMYEPHAAREDTVLFSAFHEMVSEKEYDQLGDLFEAKETEMFGERGFEKMVEKVGSLEKSLGIYDLARFTPRL